MSHSTVLSREFLETSSRGPGVYQMLGERGVLYIGKAKNLRNRLASYVRFQNVPHSKTAVMLSQLRRIEIILTTTEKEALILEASLIKKHKPRYNVILRDDKNYPFIKVTVKDDWPRIMITRKRVKDGNKYFGPYASGSALRSTIKLLFTMFPLRRCKNVLSKKRPCLNYQMGRCPAPCAGLADSQEYVETVRRAVMVLEGRNKELLAALEAKMHDAAREMKFEQAAVYRDRIIELKKTLESQAVVAGHFLDQDIFGLARRDASVAIAVVFTRAGVVSGAQNFFFNDPLGSDAQVLREMIMQYYSTQRPPPRELLLPLAPEDPELLEERLAELRGGAVSLSVPVRGKRKQLMTMAFDNAERVFVDREKSRKSWENLASALRDALKLRGTPELIECIDISNTGGKQAVGSVVCFKHGVEHKERYRHYRIRSRESPDDYAMMREVLSRKFEAALADDRRLPDLLLIDGGVGHLNMVVDLFADCGLTERIELVAIAKEKKEEGEKLFRPGCNVPISLTPHSPVLRFLMRVRDEAHRFGITFHRRLRNADSLASRLDSIQGLGAVKKKSLLAYMGGPRQIASATFDELARVPGIGPMLARAVYERFHDQGP